MKVTIPLVFENVPAATKEEAISVIGHCISKIIVDSILLLPGISVLALEEPEVEPEVEDC